MKGNLLRGIGGVVLCGVLCLIPGGCDREPQCCGREGNGAPAEIHAAAADGQHAAPGGHDTGEKVSKTESLERLKAGNARYVSGSLTHPHQDIGRRTKLAGGQSPFAIVLGCADSRTSPELVFDQGLGDLFVVRVAGNMANDQNIGSIEYSVEHLNSRLIVVLGHERCGAVKASREILASGGKAPGHIGSLIDAIKPAVESTKNADMEETVKANVKNVVKQLRESGPILKEMVDKGELGVVGAYYDLDTGAVTFFE